MGTNTSNTVRTKNSLVLKILYEVFGHYLVDRALKYKAYFRDFSARNSNVMSDIFNRLSYNWQMGKAREYLESLEEWLQGCLICHLVEDYFYDQPI